MSSGYLPICSAKRLLTTAHAWFEETVVGAITAEFVIRAVSVATRVSVAVWLNVKGSVAVCAATSDKLAKKAVKVHPIVLIIVLMSMSMPM